jgi:GGDEF domain-containing protein
MSVKTEPIISTNKTTIEDFQQRIQASMVSSNETGRPVLVILLQINNMKEFKQSRSQVVVNNLYRELLRAIRRAVHPSQFVGIFHDGLGLVFDSVETGRVDDIRNKLAALAMQVIRAGKYNDLSSKWTDIIQQFLRPEKPWMISPSIGWAIYPRDGAEPKALVQRALNHIKETNR